MHHQLFQVRFGSMRERLRKGALLMLIYPVFAVAAVIGLQGVTSLESSMLRIAAQSFLIGCLLYAAVYSVCRDHAIILSRRGKRIAAFKVSGMPLWYAVALGVVGAVCLLLWAE